MPFSRQQKEELLSRYREGMAEAPHIFLMDYKGVTVTEDTAFRRTVREVAVPTRWSRTGLFCAPSMARLSKV